MNTSLTVMMGLVDMARAGDDAALAVLLDAVAEQTDAHARFIVLSMLTGTTYVPTHAWNGRVLSASQRVETLMRSASGEKASCEWVDSPVGSLRNRAVAMLIADTRSAIETSPAVTREREAKRTDAQRIEAAHAAAEATVAAYIREHGPIPGVRVSSAQARGAAKKYAYWGAVRYEVRINAHGGLSACATERASSDRRTERGAERDAEEIASEEDRVLITSIGSLHIGDLNDLVSWIETRAEARTEDAA